jgi:hypothetical protein
MRWSPLLFGVIFLAVGVTALASAVVQLLTGMPRGGLEIVVLLLFGALFGAIGGYFLRSGLRRRAMERRLREKGVPASATVVAIAQGNVIVNDAPQFVIRYEFEDHRGRRHQGASAELPWSEVERWRAGDVGSVLVNRETPSESLWVGAPHE